MSDLRRFFQVERECGAAAARLERFVDAWQLSEALGDDGMTRRIRAARDRGVTISEELANELTELLGHDRVGIVRV